MKTSFTDSVWILRWKWISENCTGIMEILYRIYKLTQKMHIFAVSLQMDIEKLFQRQFPIVNKFISLVLRFSIFKVKQKGLYTKN